MTEEKIKMETKELEKYTILEFEIPGGVMTPEDLKAIAPPEVNPQKGVVISGRGPIWLYGFLSHHYHPTAWIGFFDPRLGGGVIIETHTTDVGVGEIVKIEE